MTINIMMTLDVDSSGEFFFLVTVSQNVWCEWNNNKKWNLPCRRFSVNIPCQPVFWVAADTQIGNCVMSYHRNQNDVVHCSVVEYRYQWLWSDGMHFSTPHHCHWYYSGQHIMCPYHLVGISSILNSLANQCENFSLPFHKRVHFRISYGTAVSDDPESYTMVHTIGIRRIVNRGYSRLWLAAQIGTPHSQPLLAVYGPTNLAWWSYCNGYFCISIWWSVHIYYALVRTMIDH